MDCSRFGLDLDHNLEIGLWIASDLDQIWIIIWILDYIASDLDYGLQYLDYGLHQILWIAADLDQIWIGSADLDQIWIMDWINLDHIWIMDYSRFGS